MVAYDRAALGEYIESRRLGQGLSIQEAVGRSGLSRTKWRDIEKGRGHLPTTQTLRQVATGLGEPPDQVFALTGLTYEAPAPPAADVEQLRQEVADLREVVANLERRIPPLPPGTP